MTRDKNISQSTEWEISRDEMVILLSRTFGISSEFLGTQVCGIFGIIIGNLKKSSYLNPWNLIKIFRISGVPTILSHILKSHQILCSLWNLTRVSLGNPDRIFITTRTSSFPLEKIEHNLWNLARISENRIMQTFWNTWNLGILRIFSQP